VTCWRNSSEGRAAFWNKDVVTPESHIAFIQTKSPYDLVWMAEAREAVVGMCGLVVDPKAGTGEAGRYFVDPMFRGLGYGLEMDRLVIGFAFDVLNLNMIWVDLYESNKAIRATHEKAGWKAIGVDLPGHTQPTGAVLHMEMQQWQWTIKSA
jgi:RimJ/RimL family protein N-acetyltransferase